MTLTIKELPSIPILGISVEGISLNEAQQILEDLKRLKSKSDWTTKLESVLDQGVRGIMAVETSWKSISMKTFTDALNADEMISKKI